MRHDDPLFVSTFESRKNIRLLAAFIRVLKDFKLPMADCLQAAEGVDSEAQCADSEYVRKLVDDLLNDEAAKKPPVTDKVM